MGLIFRFGALSNENPTKISQIFFLLMRYCKDKFLLNAQTPLPLKLSEF